MMRTETQDRSIFRSNMERGNTANILAIDWKTQSITYRAAREFTASLKKPEEIVRASYFTELVLDYKYPPERIDFEVVTKPDQDRIDILVYADDAKKDPFVVVECKSAKGME